MDLFDWGHIDASIKLRDFNKALGLMMKAFPILPRPEAKKAVVKRVFKLGFKLIDGNIVEEDKWLNAKR